MSWVQLEMPLFPRTRRTADGTYYHHDGTGRVRVRTHHVAELLRGQGVRRVAEATGVGEDGATRGMDGAVPSTSRRMRRG